MPLVTSPAFRSLTCRILTVSLVALCCTAAPARAADAPSPKAPDARPNILFCIADDWGWPHASAYGDPVVETPAFDRVAREGVLFEHAYVSSPSCTPSRSAILTGQFHWRLDEAANLWSTLRARLPVYPRLLEKAGYHVGHWRKAWGPGRLAPGGRTEPPSGDRYPNFKAFLAKRPAGKPFCFWLGASDPHRPYKAGSGKASGMDLAKIKLPACFPDSPAVRSDVADYYFEVQRFDSDVAAALAELERIGELDNTIVVITGDHGMPFPRCKGNVYDSGARVPLAVRWPAKVKGGRKIADFVSLTDLAPTFLEAAGLEPPAEMTGRSLLPMLAGGKQSRAEPQRDYVLIGKERHVPCQEAPISGGTPMRAIRTHDFLYIRNYEPERWPAGTPNYEQAYIPGTWLGDCDNGPAKTYMVENQDKDATHRRLYDLSFAKRPAEELYDLKNDPDQLKNVAADTKYAEAKKKLADRLKKLLRETNDPRETSGAEKFDNYPYYGGGPKHPGWKRKSAKKPRGKG